jgi:hypothetical protein
MHALAFLMALATRDAAAKLNLLTIISDQHRWDCLGEAGNAIIHTPVLGAPVGRRCGCAGRSRSRNGGALRCGGAVRPSAFAAPAVAAAPAAGPRSRSEPPHCAEISVGWTVHLTITTRTCVTDRTAQARDDSPDRFTASAPHEHRRLHWAA